MLTKNEIAAEIQEITGVKPNLIKNVLDALAEVVADHVAEGNDLTIPGVVKFSYDYRAPQTKGSRWKKGDTRVNNITKEETIAEADSPPVTARIRMKAQPIGLVAKVKPKTTPDAQKLFVKGKVGKRIAARKAK